MKVVSETLNLFTHPEKGIHSKHTPVLSAEGSCCHGKAVLDPKQKSEQAENHGSGFNFFNLTTGLAETGAYLSEECQPLLDIFSCSFNGGQIPWGTT